MIHCSATPEGKDYTKDTVMQWFYDRGWKNPGYRQITHLAGNVSVLQQWNSDNDLEGIEMTNGAKGWNRETIHLSYIGGVAAKKVNGKWIPKDTRTPGQIDSMITQIRFFLLLYPDIIVLGHNQISRKACPSFNVPEFLRNVVCLDEQNIYEEPLPIMVPEPFRIPEIDWEDPFDFKR